MLNFFKFVFQLFIPRIRKNTFLKCSRDWLETRIPAYIAISMESMNKNSFAIYEMSKRLACLEVRIPAYTVYLTWLSILAAVSTFLGDPFTKRFIKLISKEVEAFVNHLAGL